MAWETDAEMLSVVQNDTHSRSGSLCVRYTREWFLIRIIQGTSRRSSHTWIGMDGLSSLSSTTAPTALPVLHTAWGSNIDCAVWLGRATQHCTDLLTVVMAMPLWDEISAEEFQRYLARYPACIAAVSDMKGGRLIAVAQKRTCAGRAADWKQ